MRIGNWTIDILRNGKTYGWGKLRSIFDFFFPYTKNGKFEFIRRDAYTFKNVDGKVYRGFFTFRALFRHCFLAIPKEIWKRENLNYKRFWVSKGFRPHLIYQIGAIARDTETDDYFYDNSAGTTIAVANHTCSGSNRILFGGWMQNSGTRVSSDYNGTNLTNIDSQTADSTFYAHLDYLLAPSTSANLTLTGTFSVSGGNNAIFAMSYTGARQSGVPDATNKGSIGGVSLTVSVTTVADNCFIVGVVRDGTGQTSTPNGRSVEIYDSADGNGFWFADTTAITPAAATDVGRTRASGATIQGGVFASFAPAVAAANNSSLMMALSY